VALVPLKRLTIPFRLTATVKRVQPFLSVDVRLFLLFRHGDKNATP
jgi:hypothetical protein